MDAMIVLHDRLMEQVVARYSHTEPFFSWSDTLSRNSGPQSLPPGSLVIQITVEFTVNTI